MLHLWTFVHLFFAFSFVGSLVVAEWNGRAARATDDWRQRAMLWGIVRLASRVAGVGALVLVGIFGNLLAPAAGYAMAGVWLRWVNIVWVAGVALMAFVALPAANRLAALSAAAAANGSSEGYDRALRRWRIANLLLSLFYLAMLGLMVFRPAP